MVYVPGEWALLINYPRTPQGFMPFPSEWPSIGTQAWLYPGEYNNLAGQLAFAVDVDSIRVSAVPLMDKPDEEMLAFLIHETFHEYQYDAFGEIPWAREEKYPIQDAENSALACLEMIILMDAVQAADEGDAELCREAVRQFVAVRNYRWRQADPFVAEYEQGQEIREGTAKYVELRSLSFLRPGTCDPPGGAISLPETVFRPLPRTIMKDLSDKLTGGALAPREVARNRIYPVGSALGFLLDYFGVDWKAQAQQAGTEFKFADILSGYLNVSANEIDQLVVQAKEAYSYDQIEYITNSLVQQYDAGYRTELAGFEAQTGFRVEVSLSSNGVTRSRSTTAPRWLMDNGAVDFCNQYDMYSLQSDELVLQVHDAGILERNDWERKIRAVTFYVPVPPTIIIDGTRTDHLPGRTVSFMNIDVHNDRLKFTYHQSGTVQFTAPGIVVNLLP